MNRPFALFVVCCIGLSTAFGQKIKYKDLFVLLNAKQYDQAEPFLKKYLKENDDNPNAYLFMGMILQERSVKTDVLKQTETVKVLADSAILYLNLAHTGITEKELKRNDEFYESFSRRDLRTGEFGVKLSDVHLDIEKRVAALKERSEKVTHAKAQLTDCEKSYKRSAALYKGIASVFPGEKELLLRSDEQVVASLKQVASSYDSSMAFFDDFKGTMTALGKTGYNQVLAHKDIVRFPQDGSGEVDFYAESLPVWNYDKWATAALDNIQQEVEPLRGKLVAYDIDINKLHERIKKDSVAVTEEIAVIADKLKANPVAKFDPSPMPLQLFSMKLAELTYASLHISNKKLRDSSDLVVRLAALKSETQAIKRVDSLAANLVERSIDDEAMNYQHFVTNAYGTTLVLKSLIKATHEFAIHERIRKEIIYNRNVKSMEWLIVESDSVPLTMSRSRKYSHSPLVVQQDKFTSGLKYGADSVATGYFYTITRSRRPDVKVSFTVDKANFGRRNLPVIKGLASQDENGQVFFSAIYSETKTGDKFPVTIAKIYRTDGLAWSSNFKFEFPPSELIFSASGELTVKIASPTGESKLITIDKNGKLL